MRQISSPIVNTHLHFALFFLFTWRFIQPKQSTFKLAADIGHVKTLSQIGSDQLAAFTRYTAFHNTVQIETHTFLVDWKRTCARLLRHKQHRRVRPVQLITAAICTGATLHSEK